MWNMMNELLFICSCILVLSVGLGGGSYSPGTTFHDDTKFGTYLNETNDFYAVIFDAGSTGSRIHIYQFRHRKENGVELIHDTFLQVKPGLSNYSDDPRQGAWSLLTMLFSAIAEVPSQVHPRTPVVLKATAGLRLLPNGAADNLLNEVSALFSKTQFKKVEDCVQILDGVDEGIYSWVTVNYLDDVFSSSYETVAALDLGGGSTQITFTPKDKETVTTSPVDDIKNTYLFSKNYTLYTHSYLSLGLMAARFHIAGGNKEEAVGEDVLSSPCLPVDMKVLHHAGKAFAVSNHPKSPSYADCYASIASLVVPSIHRVAELKRHKIYAFSYFFDVAVEADIIDEIHGGIVVLAHFKTAAQKFCDSPNKDMPFLCLDLTYIYTLIKDGYGLEDESKLHLIKQIKGVEVSWTLGQAFHILSSTGVLT